MKSIVFKLSLSLFAIGLSLAALEGALWIFDMAKDETSPAPRPEAPPPPLHVTTRSPVLYGLNPKHPDINALGLRDDEMTIEKPQGTRRVLILGDSVTYGIGVPRDRTFSNRLEHRLRQAYGPVEVINAGVSGYTAYNELQYYLTEGRKLDPDIVVLAFCMNDTVNPRLHWGGYTENKIIDIPDEAIPNHEYDRKHVWPKLKETALAKAKLKKAAKPEAPLSRSKLLNLVKDKAPGMFRKEGALSLQAASVATSVTTKIATRKTDARGFPTYVTGEDTLSIEVLLDRRTPEWQWLADIFDRLHEAVRADNATFMIAILPLAYQLDTSYPYLPQKQISAYCRERDIQCIDFLPTLRQHPKADIFYLSNSIYYDIWHITDLGHELCAEVLMRSMEETVSFNP